MQWCYLYELDKEANTAATGELCVQVKDAIKVLEEWMLKEDRVMPNSYVFTCLITVLGRAGYTNKAFSLFNKVIMLLK